MWLAMPGSYRGQGAPSAASRAVDTLSLPGDTPDSGEVLRSYPSFDVPLFSSGVRAWPQLHG